VPRGHAGIPLQSSRTWLTPKLPDRSNRSRWPAMCPDIQP
jgi:hypothetical protein